MKKVCPTLQSWFSVRKTWLHFQPVSHNLSGTRITFIFPRFSPAPMKGRRVALAGPMLGAPQTVLVLERMIALGARRFIAAGWCGSLRNEVRIGDIVLPSGAISEEGTSGHYPGVMRAPSSELFNSLKSALASTGQAIHEGTVWTTDAPFRETCAKIKAFQSQGVLAVDMETSALFSVSQFRGVDLAAVLVVSDDLSGLKWVHGFRDPHIP